MIPQVFHDIHCLVRIPLFSLSRRPGCLWPACLGRSDKTQNYVRNHALGRPQIHNGESTSERVIHVGVSNFFPPEVASLCELSSDQARGTEHCLGILRQNIMCEANLEPIVFTSVNGVPESNPGATPRQCRDWEVLWPWAFQRNITSGSVVAPKAQ